MINNDYYLKQWLAMMCDNRFYGCPSCDENGCKYCLYKDGYNKGDIE